MWTMRLWETLVRVTFGTFMGGQRADRLIARRALGLLARWHLGHTSLHRDDNG
jgi:hypothetical protein